MEGKINSAILGYELLLRRALKKWYVEECSCLTVEATMRANEVIHDIKNNGSPWVNLILLDKNSKFYAKRLIHQKEIKQIIKVAKTINGFKIMNEKESLSSELPKYKTFKLIDNEEPLIYEEVLK